MTKVPGGAGHCHVPLLFIQKADEKEIAAYIFDLSKGPISFESELVIDPVSEMVKRRWSVVAVEYDSSIEQVLHVVASKFCVKLNCDMGLCLPEFFNFFLGAYCLISAKCIVVNAQAFNLLDQMHCRGGAKWRLFLSKPRGSDRRRGAEEASR
jgi:hypothetical protein